LLDAAENRIWGSTRARARAGAVGTTAKVLLLKAVLALLVPILFLLLFMGFVNYTLRSVTRAVAPPTVSVPGPTQALAADASPVQAPMRVQEPGSIPRTAWHEPTAAEIREQQRKAAEAMKIIEATTPELYEGRPDQVRGQ
jgi:restriction system protein